MQQGTPDALYSQPRDAFVAGFIGENNMLSGTVAAIANGQVRVALAGGLQVMATAVGELQHGARVCRRSAGGDSCSPVPVAEITPAARW